MSIVKSLRSSNQIRPFVPNPSNILNPIQFIVTSGELTDWNRLDESTSFGKMNVQKLFIEV